MSLLRATWLARAGWTMGIGEFVESKIEEQPDYEKIFKRSVTRTVKDLLIAATIVAITSLAVIMGRLWRLIAGDHTLRGTTG